MERNVWIKWEYDDDKAYTRQEEELTIILNSKAKDTNPINNNKK